MLHLVQGFLKVQLVFEHIFLFELLLKFHVEVSVFSFSNPFFPSSQLEDPDHASIRTLSDLPRETGAR